MWLSSSPSETRTFRLASRRASLLCAATLMMAAVAGCTVSPLNSATNSGATSDGVSSSVAAQLAGITISPVSTRVAQQVRNELLNQFGASAETRSGLYSLSLVVTHAAANIAVERSAKAPTAAQVTVRVTYGLTEKSTGNTVGTGLIQTLAAYDRTSQSFANQRALRDAENRAAKEAASRVRLAVAQKIAEL